jgi:hypothetical protein
MPRSTSDDGYLSCKSCAATFPTETVPDDILDDMMSRRGYQDLLDEMELLRRAQALLDAHPEAEQVIDSIQRRGMDALYSEDEGQGETGGDEQWLAAIRQLGRWTEGDSDLREYLEEGTVLTGLGMRTNELKYMLVRQDWIGRLQDPACPRCGEHTLRFEGRVDWVSFYKKQQQREQT